MIIRLFIIFVCSQFLTKANSSSDSLYEGLDYSQDGLHLPDCVANDSNTSSWGSCPPWSTCKNNSCSLVLLYPGIYIFIVQEVSLKQHHVCALHTTKTTTRLHLEEAFSAVICTVLTHLKIFKFQIKLKTSQLLCAENTEEMELCVGNVSITTGLLCAPIV